MFSVHYINFDYGHDGFSSLEAAVTHARKVCFEAVIYNDQHQLVATYNPLSGIKYIEVNNV